MRTNRLADGVTIFKAILHSLLVNIVSSQSQVEEARSIISKALEYTLAMSVELARREMAAASDAEQTLQRQLELNAYFTIPKLEVAHRQLALTAAMKQAFSKKQFSSSLSFANRVIANGTPAKLVENVSHLQPLSHVAILTHNRRPKSKYKANEPDRRTVWILSSIHLPNSMSVPLPTPQSTAAVPPSPVLSTEQNIMIATRAKSAGYVRSVRSALRLVA